MNRVLFNVCGFYPFFPLCFSLISPLRLVCLVWYKIIQSSPLHTTFPLLFFSTSPPVTLLSSSENPPSSLSSSHYCVAVCGWASSLLYSPPPPLPFLVKERMRLEREEATRLLEEETEVRHSSWAGLQTTFLSVQKGHKNTTALPQQDFTMFYSSPSYQGT